MILESALGTLIGNFATLICLLIVAILMRNPIKQKKQKFIRKQKQNLLGDLFD